MLFSSYAFLLIFLPSVLAGFFFLRPVASQPILAGYITSASWLFYAMWDWRFLPLLIVSTAVNYLVAKKLHRKCSKYWLLAGITFNLFLLGFFKYTDFLLETLTSGIHMLELALPLAISFYTFQQIAFLCDIYHTRTQLPKPYDYAFFVSFFPQLIAGPIVHARELIPQLQRLQHPPISSQIITGFAFLAIGLAKKVLIADTLAPGVDQLYSSQVTTAMSQMEILAAASGYGLQLYFDFSGYADMAIGLALLFGIKLPENFNSPYKSLSVTDFWRRWHMTLSHFLRDYLYIGLGGSRHGRLRTIINLCLTMLLGGLWHGAGWQFLIWGAIHGIMLSIHYAWRNLSPWQLPAWAALPFTFLCISLAWIPFRAEDSTTAMNMLTQLLTADLWRENNIILGETPLISLLQLDSTNHILWYIVPCITIVWLMPNTANILSRLPLRTTGLISGVLLFLVLKTLYERPEIEFLYFNF
jgi:alginate O-acetyltransferase complex protein AlgI